MGGFVEHTFQRFVVCHNLKGSPVQEQMEFLATEITGQSFYLDLAVLFLWVCEAPTSILHDSPTLLFRLSLREGCGQPHRASINVELVFRLGIKVCLERIATKHVLEFLECFRVFLLPLEFSRN